MGIFDRLFGRKPSDISESDHAKPHRQDALTKGVTSPKHSWESLPEGFQTSEFLLEHGFIDKIVERKNLKDTLYKLIKLHKGGAINEQ